MRPGTIAYKTVNFQKTHGVFLVILIFILSGCGLYSSYRTISSSDWERFSSSIPGTPGWNINMLFQSFIFTALPKKWGGNTVLSFKTIYN